MVSKLPWEQRAKRAGGENRKVGTEGPGGHDFRGHVKPSEEWKKRRGLEQGVERRVLQLINLASQGPCGHGTA